MSCSLRPPGRRFPEPVAYQGAPSRERGLLFHSALISEHSLARLLAAVFVPNFKPRSFLPPPPVVVVCPAACLLGWAAAAPGVVFDSLPGKREEHCQQRLAALELLSGSRPPWNFSARRVETISCVSASLSLCAFRNFKYAPQQTTKIFVFPASFLAI